MTDDPRTDPTRTAQRDDAASAQPRVGPLDSKGTQTEPVTDKEPDPTAAAGDPSPHDPDHDRRRSDEPRSDEPRSDQPRAETGGRAPTGLTGLAIGSVLGTSPPAGTFEFLEEGSTTGRAIQSQSAQSERSVEDDFPDPDRSDHDQIDDDQIDDDQIDDDQIDDEIDGYEIVGERYASATSDHAPRRPVSRIGYVVGTGVALVGIVISALIALSMVRTVDSWNDTQPIKAGSAVELDLSSGTYNIMVMVPHTGGFDLVLSDDVDGSHLARPYKWGRSITVSVAASDGTELTVEPNLDIASFANDTYRFITVGSVDIPSGGRYSVVLSQPELVAPIPVPAGIGIVKLDIRSLLTRLAIVAVLLPLFVGAGLLLVLVTFIRRRIDRRSGRRPPGRFSAIFRPQTVAFEQPWDPDDEADPPEHESSHPRQPKT